MSEPEPLITTIDPSVLELFDSSTKITLQGYELTPYKVPLCQPWQTANHTIHYRQGYLIKLISTDNLTGIGECAPMPEAGTEELQQAQGFLENYLQSFLGKPLTIHQLQSIHSMPASRFALETALLELIRNRTQKPFYQQLNPNFSRQIKTNLMIGPLNESISSIAQEAEAQGFKCLKIKMGLHSIEHEGQKLGSLLTSLPADTKIRLDANRSWDKKQSQWLLNFLEQNGLTARIDSIEEPLLYYDQKTYQDLQSSTPVTLALDESLKELETLENYPVRRIVIKPTVTGGIFNSWQIARLASQSHIETVITSCLETGYGLWPISYLCAAINNDQFHGLATSGWLQDTLIKPPEIHYGLITL